MEMKFTFSPLVLLALLFASSFAAPTEKGEGHLYFASECFPSPWTISTIHLASSKLGLKFSFSGYEYGAVGIRDVETNADEYRLNKRVQFGRNSLVNIADSPISLKRSTEEADEEFSKRSKTYNLVVSSLSPVNRQSDRLTDAYEGRHVVVYMCMRLPVLFVWDANFAYSRPCSGRRGSWSRTERRDSGPDAPVS